MTLYSDAIEYYGANDDNEMCIDLNMRMQSVLVRPYILDCLCDHNHVSNKEKNMVSEKLEDARTNFESDNRRSYNPFKYKKEETLKEEEPKTPPEESPLKNKVQELRASMAARRNLVTEEVKSDESEETDDDSASVASGK
jgi:hypothetical protein